MNNSGTIRYDIRTGTTGRHISGTIQTEDGMTHPFEGWLGLLGTLESLVDDSQLTGNGRSPAAVGRTSADGHP